MEGHEDRRAWQMHRTTCDICRVELATGSLRRHQETQHGVYTAFAVPAHLQEAARPTVQCMAHRPTHSGTYTCPVPGCPGRVATLWKVLRHFRYRHPLDKVSTAEEGTLTKCEACVMQVSETVRGLRHKRSKTCHDLRAQQRQHEAAATAVEAPKSTFTAYGESLHRVEVFKYLGRLVSYNNVNTQAIRGNLKKCRKTWARISKVLRAEHVSPPAGGKSRGCSHQNCRGVDPRRLSVSLHKSKMGWSVIHRAMVARRTPM